MNILKCFALWYFRAFCVWEEKLPVDDKAEQIELRLLQEYKKKLILSDGDVIPDPFTLTTGWKGEKSGISMWPSIYITDISAYLNYSTPQDVINRLLNEYKEGKAYRYFESKWVQEVFVHDIRPNSDKCVLKCKVTPSQSLNNKAYDAWAVVKKDGANGPGGEIISAYCSCTAGMLGACNHVAGLLFRVEYAVKTGATQTSSTSKLSTWNVPKKKPDLKPMKVKDVVWTKGKYSKGPTEQSSANYKHEMKKNFTPLNKRQLEIVNNQQDIRKDLYDIIKDEVKDSCFVLLQENRRIAVPKANLPASVMQVAELVKNSGSDNMSNVMMDKLQLTEQDCEALKNETTAQSFSDVWKEQRKGRLTASIFQRISTRVDTLRKDPSADPSALLKTVLGKAEVKQTSAMKHGIALEPVAKKAYVTLMKSKHKRFKSKDSGLAVLQSKPFIAASADLETDCECCGKGLCEIKCPESIKNTSPSADNLKYLKLENGTLSLDTNHPYYSQIQGQMKILDRKHCDLFVFTYHGHECIRVPFDEQFWLIIEEKLVWFWNNFVLKALLSSVTDEIDTENQMPTSQVSSVEVSGQLDMDSKAQIHVACRKALEPVLESNTSASNIPTAPRKRRRLCIKKTRAAVYLCGVCGLDCIDKPMCDSENSVNCDACGAWVHYVCANVTDVLLVNVDKWFCPRCK
ncbi:hypothetical protein DPMN_118996 [Dreissena polymorpha]|uniref:PHD-type domain-containing protein n=1 Tax=Dreissena polymorpha TaxID=45954 RepID=A0A9D4JME7_DREPO|nr:hypothetical protein DPMN_118995 [Dreissena polymorpha]KAH3817460.1 hypothetical protein DPMN_118996 [Dreissena polymorpha]